MTPREEAERLLDISGSPKAAFDVLEKQMGVLVVRTQVLLSLCGALITVTGMSGRNIVQVHPVARVLVAMGLFTVLTAAATALGGVFRVTWITKRLQPDVLASLEEIVRVRDHKARFLRAAAVLFMFGFSGYVGAVGLLIILG